MNKSDLKGIFKQLENEKKLEGKTTFTFRISKADLDRFRELCESQGYSAGSVIEKLIKQFLQASK